MKSILRYPLIALAVLSMVWLGLFAETQLFFWFGEVFEHLLIVPATPISVATIITALSMSFVVASGIMFVMVGALGHVVKTLWSWE